ncbi:MAG: hypothetical protein AAFN18_23200 [Cyanobacteria bacterium J06554_6]
MNFFSQAEIKERIDLSELSSLFVSLVRLAIQDPITWYVFLQRYTYFNSYSAGAAYRLASSIALSRYLFVQAGELVREEADRGSLLADQLMVTTLRQELCQHTSRRTLVQAILRSAGDYAGLLTIERNYLAAVPSWLEDLVGEFINQYQGTPGNIISLVKATGVHAASEMLDTMERQQLAQTVSQLSSSAAFHRYLVQHLPSTFLRKQQGWCEILGRSEWQVSAESARDEADSGDALAVLEQILVHRPESAQQIQHWALEGMAIFVELQRVLLKEIYRECLNMLHGDRLSEPETALDRSPYGEWGSGESSQRRFWSD